MLAGGRVVSGGSDGRVRVWDPAVPGIGLVELGSHDGPVSAVAVLSDERVASGSKTREGQLRLWDVESATEIDRVVCSIAAIAVTRASDRYERLLTSHEGQGMTMWSVRPLTEA